jgi:hypothetical protein
LSQTLKQRKLVIVQFRKRDAFRVAIKLFILLLVSHFTEFTLCGRQSNRNKTLDRGIRASPLRFKRRLSQRQVYFGCSGGCVSRNSRADFPRTGPVSGSDRKKLKFFEMSAKKIFRKGEPNRVNQPKPT